MYRDTAHGGMGGTLNIDFRARRGGRTQTRPLTKPFPAPKIFSRRQRFLAAAQTMRPKDSFPPPHQRDDDSQFRAACDERLRHLIETNDERRLFAWLLHTDAEQSDDIQFPRMASKFTVELGRIIRVHGAGTRRYLWLLKHLPAEHRVSGTE